MRVMGLGCVALLALTGAARAQVIVHGPKATAEAILAADRAFDAQSARDGAAKAFRDNLDPIDGLEFAGGEPARGAAAIYKAQGGDGPSRGVLHWEPSEVFASTGDMGATWGRWTFTPAVAGAKPITGRYVTVWRKDAAGHWRGIIDIGNPD